MEYHLSRNVSKSHESSRFFLEEGKEKENIRTAHEDSGVVVASETSAGAWGGLAIVVGWPLGHVVDVGVHGTPVGVGETIEAVVGDTVGASLESMGLVGEMLVLGVVHRPPKVVLGHLCFNLVVLASEGYVRATGDDWTNHSSVLEGQVDLLALLVAGFDQLGNSASGGDGGQAEGEETECEHIEGVESVEVLTVIEGDSSEVRL